MKARRTGAVLLHLYAASYGRWLLSMAHPPPSPFRATGLLLGLGPSFLSCLSCLVANFATGRLSEPVKRFTIEAVVACALGAQTVHSHCFPAYGLWGELSDQTEFPDHGSSPEPQSDNLGAHFLRDAEKCCDFLLHAHCRVSRLRFQPARRGVSRAQFGVSRKWLIASRGHPDWTGDRIQSQL